MPGDLSIEMREEDHRMSSLLSPRSQTAVAVSRAFTAQLDPGAVVVRCPADGTGWTALLLLAEERIRLIREEAGPLFSDLAF